MSVCQGRRGWGIATDDHGVRGRGGRGRGRGVQKNGGEHELGPTLVHIGGAAEKETVLVRATVTRRQLVGGVVVHVRGDVGPQGGGEGVERDPLQPIHIRIPD